MKSEFEIAITQLCSDRNLSPQIVLKAIEDALVSAYKHNYGTNQNIGVALDPRTGQARIFVKKAVAEQVEDERMEIPLAEARELKADAAVGDFVDVEVKPKNFGRIAAQTAKQVIMQRIREAERDSIYLEYADRAGEIVNGTVRNIDAHTGSVTLSLGKAEALLPRSEQIPGEHYRFNQHLRVYVVEVESSGHGPQISVSRTHRGLLRRLLELEVPEIFSGTVEIKGIAREPGSRSKVAVAALQPGIDPVGSCVGMRGVRIQNIVNELNGEKIDVVAWSPAVETFIGNALSPAKVLSVYLNEAEKSAKVIVPDKVLSLAIGKEGQNARLAAKLTGWRIDIRSESEAAAEVERHAAEDREAAERAEKMEAERRAAAELLAEAEASLDEEVLQTDAPAQPGEEILVGEVTLEAPTQETEQESPSEVLEPLPIMTEEEEELGYEEPTGEEIVPEEALAAEEDLAGAWEEPTPEPASEEGTEEDRDAAQKKARTKKDRKRTLEFDERLGRVVARKKRKPSRSGIFEPAEDGWEE